MPAPKKRVEQLPLGGDPGLQERLREKVLEAKRRVLNRFNDPGYVLTLSALTATALMRPELPQEAAAALNGVVLGILKAAQEHAAHREGRVQALIALRYAEKGAEQTEGLLDMVMAGVQVAVSVAAFKAGAPAAAMIPQAAAALRPTRGPQIPAEVNRAKQRKLALELSEATRLDKFRTAQQAANFAQQHAVYRAGIDARKAATEQNNRDVQAVGAHMGRVGSSAAKLLFGTTTLAAYSYAADERERENTIIIGICSAALGALIKRGWLREARRMLDDTRWLWLLRVIAEMFCVLAAVGFAQAALGWAQGPPSLEVTAAPPPSLQALRELGTAVVSTASGIVNRAGGAKQPDPTYWATVANLLAGPIEFAEELEDILTPHVVAALVAVNAGPFVEPTVVDLRPLDGDPAVTGDDVGRAADLLGGTNLESRASIHPRSLGVKDSNPMLQTLPGADTYSHPGLVDLALSAVWEQPLINESSGLDAYLFCTKANWKKWTGRDWPFGGVMSRSFPKDAAEGIAINSNAPYTLATPMKFDLAFVQGGSEGNFAAAAEDLVVGIFGSQTKHSSVTEWRWTWTGEDPPTTLSELPDNAQRAVAAGAIYTAPVNRDLFLGPDPRQSPIEAFLKNLALTLATAELYYSMFPAACLNTDVRDVALPPHIGNPIKLEVNILLWTAWERLCSTKPERQGRWTDTATLKTFLTGQDRIRSGETATRHFDTLQRMMPAAPAGRRSTLSELLNLGPITSAGTGNRGKTLRVCRYYLYLLIPEDKRGLNDASIGGIYSAIIWKGMPGFCPICNKAATTVRWVIDDDGQMINGWVLPPPTSAINDDYNDRRLLLVESGRTKEGCIKCYQKEGIELIKGARNDDEAADRAVQLATQIRDGDEDAEEEARARFRRGP